MLDFNGINLQSWETLLFDSPYDVWHEGEFYCVNPLDKAVNRNNRGAQSLRADVNVREFRNFVFETDKVDLDTQRKLIAHLVTALNVRLVTFSGSKSYHIVLSLADNLPYQPHTESGIQGYKNVWRGLADVIESEAKKIGIKVDNLLDPSTKNPSRLTRRPSAVRLSSGLIQIPVYQGGLITSEFALSNQAEAQQPLGLRKPINAELDTTAFEAELEKFNNSNLRFKLARPELWAASANMYPELFRLTLWAIDATGVPKDTLLTYLDKKVFPKLIEVGYPSDKLEDAIHNAYEWKQ